MEAERLSKIARHLCAGGKLQPLFQAETQAALCPFEIDCRTAASAIETRAPRQIKRRGKGKTRATGTAVHEKDRLLPPLTAVHAMAGSPSRTATSEKNLPQPCSQLGNCPAGGNLMTIADVIAGS